MSANLESSNNTASASSLELAPAESKGSSIELSSLTSGDSYASDSSSINTALSTSLVSSSSIDEVRALGQNDSAKSTDVPTVEIDQSGKPIKVPYMNSVYTALSTGISPEQSEIKLASLTKSSNPVPDLSIVQGERAETAKQELNLTNPFPDLKLVNDGKSGLVIDARPVIPRDSSQERIPAFGEDPGDLPNSNRKIIETSHQFLNQKPWQKSRYSQYLENGKLASATSVSEVLKSAGFKFQDSANPGNLVKRLIAEGWTMHGVKQAQAGDLVFGGKLGANWRNGAGNADIGIVSAHGKYIYHNDKGSGNWTASELGKVFSDGEYGGQVWVLRPPKEIPKESNYKPQNDGRTSPHQRPGDGSVTPRRIVIDKPNHIPHEDRPDSTRPGDGRQNNPESNYWSDYWKGYWNNYWRDYWRDHYSNSNRRQDVPNHRPGSRTDLVPNGWDYNQHNRRPDSNQQGRIDDRLLPPEWRNDGWRGGDRRDPRQPGDNSYRYPTNRNAKIVRHRPGNLAMLGPPTITPQKINEVLRQYNSPAQGMGQLVFDLGVEHGINPAIALAFFIKESSAGTKGIARTTRNWGNRKGNGPAGRYKGFMRYNNFEESLRDWFPYMHRVYINKGLKSLPSVIAKYAPGYDGNNERGYVRTVDRLLTKWSV